MKKPQLDLGLDMARPAEQMVFDLAGVSGSNREDVIVTDANAAAAAYLDLWPRWASPLTVLSGPAGSGKSHLARVWAVRSGASVLDPREIDDPDLGDDPFLIEDADRSGLDMRGLFHLINLARSRGLTGLVTTRYAPGSWRTGLPDLDSRLRAATQIALTIPDEGLLGGVALKLLSERQLDVEPAVLDTLIQRGGRSLTAIASLVRRLDYMALVKRKPITRALVLEAVRMEAGQGF